MGGILGLSKGSPPEREESKRKERRKMRCFEERRRCFQQGRRENREKRE